jgi:Fic family protein
MLDLSILGGSFDMLSGLVDRIDDSLYLVSQGLIGQPVRCLSRAIIEDKHRYNRLLQAVTATGAWEPWIEFMLVCVERTAIWTTDKVRGDLPP